MDTVVTLERQILVALRRISHAMDSRSRTLLRRYGLTGPQLTALLTIARLQPVTAGAIAREVQLGHSTVSGILDRLERRGWIGRSRGASDRRQVNLCLTAAGEQLLATVPPPVEEPLRERLAQLEEWERTQILATFQRVAEMMETMWIAGPELGETAARS